ncbi:MAG: hypothetical protein WAO55_16140 [Candidatus Manganitrophaceae bacterium]
MTEQTLSLPTGWERRSPRLFNRLRRKLNDYWLIPLLVCQLQLATQFFHTADPPLERLYKGNRTFFQGIPILYKIVSHEFPYAFIGHFYELVEQGLYSVGYDRVSHGELQTALSSPGAGREIYDRLIASRQHRESELGGILTLSYHGEKPVVRLHEIPSLNEIYLDRLRKIRHSLPEVLAFLTAEENQEVFEKLGLGKQWTTNLETILQRQNLPDATKQTLIDNFIETYQALSDSRYLLSPYQLKGALGKIPFGERFVGLYHFHNGMNEPPSSIDIDQSLRRRQLVMTFSETGWIFYDISKRALKQINVQIDKAVALQ